MGIRILFVDDEPMVLQSLRRMLHVRRPCDWEPYFATGAREALNILAETTMDVIVSDIRMPEMDGVQLLREVMRVAPETLRIALSGDKKEDLPKGSDSVYHLFLCKPCNFADLTQSIARLLASRSEEAKSANQGAIP